jgi:hypothetical protein
MARLNRTTAAAFLAGMWLTSPLAVGVAAADRTASDSASDSASGSSDGESAGGSTLAPRLGAASSVQDDAEPSTSEAMPIIAVEPPEADFDEIDQLPVVVKIDEPAPDKPAVAVEDALPEAQSGEAVEDVEAVVVIEDALPEAQPGETVEDVLPGEAVVESPGEAGEDAAPESEAEPTDPATEDAGGNGAPETDPEAEESTEDQQYGDVAGGRGGGVTPLPFWRGAVGDPQTEGEPEPIALESTSVDPDVPDPDSVSPDVVIGPPVYYFETTTDPADLQVLTTGGPDQTPGSGPPQSVLGSGTLIEAIANGINQILDAVGAWISGLPAGPLQELLAGVLLLVRNALPQEWVKLSRPSSGQLIGGGGDGGSGESDTDSGEADSDDTDRGDTDTDTDDLVEGLTGLSESDAATAAEERGLTLRVVARDGEYFAVTKDYRTDRVNLVIDNGVVVEATIG